jgi:hypothetical protein
MSTSHCVADACKNQSQERAATTLAGKKREKPFPRIPGHQGHVLQTTQQPKKKQEERKRCSGVLQRWAKTASACSQGNGREQRSGGSCLQFQFLERTLANDGVRERGAQIDGNQQVTK